MTVLGWLLMASVGVPMAIIALVFVCIAIAHLVGRLWGDC